MCQFQCRHGSHVARSPKGNGVYFCVRDDDTSFFTSPDELENAYGRVTQWGPISLAVVPFHRAGTSKAVPERYRGRWSVHPLHENRALVEYLRSGASTGRFEIMLHGYNHDEPSGRGEFAAGDNLVKKITDARKYLQDLLSAEIRVFVPPRNLIGRQGLRAVVHERLHLGGTVGVRSGWSLSSRTTWANWLKLRRWRKESAAGIPWVLDLGDHRELPGNAVTPVAQYSKNQAAFETALKVGGAFCAATHYWELEAASTNPGDPPVGVHLRQLMDLVRSDPRILWQSVGDVICNGPIL